MPVAVDCMRTFQIFVGLLMIMNAVKAENTVILPLSQFQQTIEQLSKKTIKIIYSIRTVQYPNYQEEVFSGNDAVLEKLRNKTEFEEITTEYIKVVVAPRRLSCHRIREQGKTGEIGLNSAIVANELTVRSLVYPPMNKHDLCASRDPIKAKLDITRPRSKTKVSFPILPWNMVQDRILEVTGWTNSQNWSNQVINNASPNVVWNSKEFILKTETGPLVTSIHFSKEMGMPTEVVGIRTDKPIKYIVNLTYKKVNASTGPGTWFPIKIENIKQIEISGRYKTYLSKVLEVYSVSFVESMESDEFFSKDQPFLFSSSELLTFLKK